MRKALHGESFTDFMAWMAALYAGLLVESRRLLVLPYWMAAIFAPALRRRRQGRCGGDSLSADWQCHAGPIQ